MVGNVCLILYVFHDTIVIFSRLEIRGLNCTWKTELLVFSSEVKQSLAPKKNDCGFHLPGVSIFNLSIGKLIEKP